MLLWSQETKLLKFSVWPMTFANFMTDSSSLQYNYLTISNMVLFACRPCHAGYLLKLLIISLLQCTLLYHEYVHPEKTTATFPFRLKT